MLAIDGRIIDYEEAGDGPAIVFVPGSFSTPAAWRGLQSHLPRRYRLIGTSLCGYGRTGESRTVDDHGIEHEIRVVEAVARRAAGPVHLVGHSFGACVALAAALAGAIDVLTITTFEANSLHLIRDSAKPELFELARRVSSQFEAAQHAGEPDAVSRIIDFWGGQGSFARMPGPAQAYCRATGYTNVLDWRTAFGFEARRADYARLAVPVLLVRGALANPAVVEITDVLKMALPNARSSVVDGAGHFLIISHAKECAGLLCEFLESAVGETVSERG